MKTILISALLIISSSLFAIDWSPLTDAVKEAGETIGSGFAPVGEALKETGAEIGDAFHEAWVNITSNISLYFITVEFIHSDNNKSTKIVKEIPVPESYYNSVQVGDVILNKLWMIPVFGKEVLNDQCTIIEKRVVLPQ
jgi:hypothetical protein